MPTVIQSDKYASSNLGTAQSYGLVVPAFLTGYTFEAAYSLRQLTQAYAGPCLKVHNESNAAQGDVAFAAPGYRVTTASIVTITAAGSSGYTIGQTMTLATFAGAGDVSVVRWYDQSGNGRSIGNGTASTTLFPKLMVSGAFQTTNGFPYIAFDGSTDRMDTTTGSGGPAAWTEVQPYTIIGAGIVAASGHAVFWDRKQTSASSSAGQFQSLVGGARQIYAGAFLTDGLITTESDKTRCYGAVYDGASSSIWVDGVQVGSTGNAGTNGAEDFRLGVTWNNAPYGNKYWEVLVLGSAANVAEISAKMMAYYGLD